MSSAARRAACLPDESNATSGLPIAVIARGSDASTGMPPKV
jgi:hypothetical protein